MQSRFQNDVSLGLSRLPCGHSRIKNGGPTASQLGHSANISCKSGGSIVTPHTQWKNTHTHTVGPATRSHGHFNTHVRNTDDFKKYQGDIAAVDTSCSLCLLLCIFSFEFHHAQYNTDLGSANQLCRNTPLPWLLTLAFSNRPSCCKLPLHPRR